MEDIAPKFISDVSRGSRLSAIVRNLLKITVFSILVENARLYNYNQSGTPVNIVLEHPFMMESIANFLNIHNGLYLF